MHALATVSHVRVVLKVGGSMTYDADLWLVDRGAITVLLA